MFITQVSGPEQRDIFERQQDGPIVFVSDSHAPSLWTKFLQLKEKDRLQRLKKMVGDQAESDVDDEDEAEEKEQSIWSWRKVLKSVFGDVNKKTAIKGTAKSPDSYNLYNRKPDFRNSYGWSVALTSSDYPPLKLSDIGVYLVNLTAVSKQSLHCFLLIKI